MATQRQVNRTRNTDVLSDAQRLDWLQLIRSPHVGPASFRELINHYGSARDALAALPDIMARMGPAARRKTRDGQMRRGPASRASVEAEYETALGMGAQLVAPGEAGYPAWLAETDGAPPLIYIMGDAALAARPIVAIVGSREASAAGRALAEEMARELGAAGFVVASGLARGIDGAAHRASLDTGTLAVIAGGIDSIYPTEHGDLHREIAARGLLITEMPPGHQPRAKDFPRRNRIVSGVTQGVVVIEAARRSGTLITARLAGEQGRQVFAVPGHPLDPRADGTNMLLRTGATLATRAADVIEALAPLDQRASAARQAVPWIARCDGAVDGGEAVALRESVPGREVGSDVEVTETGDLFAVAAGAEETTEIPAPPVDMKSGMEEAVHSLLPFAHLNRAHATAAMTDQAYENTPADTRETVISALGTTPIAIDTLCRVTGLATPHVRGVITELDPTVQIE
ncbi:MAG: DNA-processing protein DprA, partial [Pseudomonadota bacterium]